ncbi:M14 family metallopeptidase [Arsenicibacter rosenii]|uniref:Peptidase n=1 Tax=Arsenicibacter rosenii TaxID=1750698 RepID=A0A1S2VNR5_9BACT|nr:M14 family metallopeptidase [Arsenicibacter rosenii]OIN60422.1 peptidase [Arsenicibacter rosenii]
MKQYVTLLVGMLLAAGASAQKSYYGTEPKWPEQDTTKKFYTVKGERHGISFFKKHYAKDVEYFPGTKLSFDVYHAPEVMYSWCRKWADQYPNLVDLYEVAKSYEGRPILQLTLTNKKTGKHTNKPAAYFEGGRHSGEVTSSEAVMWLAKYLLDNYGKDPAITRLLDTKTIYLRPQNNPDGATMYLYTAQRNRSTVHPKDDDRDGLLDEDPEEELDNDGVIYQIRKKATAKELEKADYVLDPRDPRLMKKVQPGQGQWLVYTEGIDNDGDGKYNEDGVGGLDNHRNYPENWRPDQGGDFTGRGFTQGGAGEYPLSEIETRATVLWLLGHPNISVVNSMDTRVPMHLRPPSTSSGEESMFPPDLAIYKHMDSLGLSFTGYPWAGDVYNTYHTRSKTDRLTGDPTKPTPLFGHGPDFGYFYYGSVWYGDELWNGGAMKDYDSDGQYDEYDGLRWDDEANNKRGFKPWTKFTHPQLGEVEIGGFHPKFFAQNGPAWQLENWISKQAKFNLAMAFELPQITLKDVSVKPLANNEYEITVSWSNTGKLPVALEQAKRIKIVQEDQVSLDIDKDLLKGFENAKVTITKPALFDKTIYAGYTGTGESKEAAFTVKLNQPGSIKAKVKLSSTRGGYIEKEITIGK